MLLAGVLLAICGLGTPQAAADPDHAVKVTLTKLTPSVVKPNSDVVFRGKVTNTSDRPLERLQASIWRSLMPLTTRSQLQTTNKSAPQNPIGQRMYRESGSFTDLSTSSKPNLAPGKSVHFTVHAKADELLQTSVPNDGIYVAGIQIRENGQTVGRSRTYLPVQSRNATKQWRKSPAGRESRVSEATLVKLTSTPTMARAGVFVDESLARQVSTGGRLDKLLTTAAKSKHTSYAVDPNLISELQAMRDGYRVVDGHGKTRSGSGASAAKSWLKRFTKMQRSHDGYRLPYGQPDFASLLRHGSKARAERIAADGQAATDRVTTVSDLPLLMAPRHGAAPSSVLELANKLKARAVLLSSDTVRSRGALLDDDGGPTILSYDTGADTGPGPDPRDTPVQRRQAQLASSYVDALSGPQSNTRHARLRVVGDKKPAAHNSPSAPWLIQRRVSKLLDAEPSRLTGQPSYPARARRAELNDKQLDKVDSLRRGLALYEGLLADPKRAHRRAQQALPRTASSHWRGHAAAMKRFRHHQGERLKTSEGHVASLRELRQGDLVHVESNPHVTLTGASGRLPVTVVNKLDATIQVRLRARSPNRSRLDVDGLSAAKIGDIKAGSHRPAQVPAHANANGTLPVTLQLVNTHGTRLGKKQTVQVNATRAGAIGWVIVVGAGIVLLGAVALRVRQVRRERSSQQATPAEGDADAPTTNTTAEQPTETENPAENEKHG